FQRASVQFVPTAFSHVLNGFDCRASSATQLSMRSSATCSVRLIAGSGLLAKKSLISVARDAEQNPLSDPNTLGTPSKISSFRSSAGQCDLVNSQAISLVAAEASRPPISVAESCERAAGDAA